MSVSTIRFPALLVAMSAAACGSPPGSPAPEPAETGRLDTVAAAPTPHGTAAPREFVAERLVLVEWAKAENRASCAPLAFADVGAGGWSARRAEFSGGWAVAFDLPAVRSAFGVAGTGVLDENANAADRRAALSEQWPYVRELPALDGFAGYGLEGAAPYPPGDPGGEGSNSLAYVRVAGQDCLYNVWSRLGRAHLETLLDQLRPVEPRG